MLIATTILYILWAIISNSPKADDADIQLNVYNRTDREFVWGVSQRSHYLPSKTICTTTSVGIGPLWLNINFYKFPG